MKDKTAKMKRCAAGEHIPAERAEELAEAALGFASSVEFASGISFACAFLACEKGDPRFGMTPAEFYDHGPLSEEPPAEVGGKAYEIIEELERMGVEVVSAYIVEGGR